MNVATGDSGGAQGGIVRLPYRSARVEKTAKLIHLVEGDAGKEQAHQLGLAPRIGAGEFIRKPCYIVEKVVGLLDWFDLLQIGWTLHL